MGMNRARFAQLCGVSKPMISKYEGMGLIKFADNEGKRVDVLASLDAMAGRLDEDRRIEALARFAALNGDAKPSLPRAVTERKTAGLMPDDKPMSHKQEKDYFDAKLKEIEYRRAVGELVLASDVQETATLAVAALRETFSNQKRDLAKGLCAQFDIPPDKETAVMRFLSKGVEEAIGKFGAVCQTMADAKHDISLNPDQSADFSHSDESTLPA